MTASARQLHDIFVRALNLEAPEQPVALPDGGTLASVFAVSDLAQASIGAAGTALAALAAVQRGGRPATATVNRDLASAWFRGSLRPQGWELPPVWDDLSGDYACRDGWIKLHANAPRHRAAVLDVLAIQPDRAVATDAVGAWSAYELETAVINAGGAAAALRSLDEWREHPQGRAVASEPLVSIERTSNAVEQPLRAKFERPLGGIRVLDLTRVLAGPVATRLLAGWGADVLRIDPPDWDEPAVVAEVTLGKRCARLDLRSTEGVERFLELLAGADVFVHGYRSDALERLGLGDQVRDAIRPGLVDVCLDAYGWSGPWRGRRGFDSLVQMSTGIADEGRIAARSDRPVPLPVQALDHATGYLMAASALAGLTLRHTQGVGSRWRTSLARMALVLISTKLDGDSLSVSRRGEVVAESSGSLEHTAWGDAVRLAPPLVVDGSPLEWTIAAHRLGSDEAKWPGAE